MSRILFFILVMMLCLCRLSFSQNVPQLQKLKDYVQQNIPAGYDSAARYVYLSHGSRINYLYPLYQLFRDERKFRSLFHNRNYYDELSGYISFTEDYQSSLQYAIKGYDTISLVTQKQILKSVDGLKNISHADARIYLSFLASGYRVIMINEAHNKPLHRAFVISLLADLYRKGYRYLAMEMLNNFGAGNTPGLTASTGHYSAEPVAGELIRIAKETGYTLIAYEDTLAYKHTPLQRDSAQAGNIYQVFKNDTTAKILVLGSYGHIAEHSSLPDYIPMAMAFKKLSGIDPLTVDQTDMTEESNIEYGRMLYRTYTQKYPILTASVAMVGNQPINITNNPDYDLGIIQPPTTYREGRPTWLALGGLRKALYVKPSVKNTFLIQAYYRDEFNDKIADQSIPADQTYIPTNKENFLLYLRKGKYVIVSRDMDYRVLGRLDVEVN